MLVQGNPKRAVTAAVMLGTGMASTLILPYQNQDWGIQMGVTAMSFSHIPVILLVACIWLFLRKCPVTLAWLSLDSF